MTGEFSIEESKAKRVYTKSDIVISIISFILGYLFIKWIFTTSLGLGACAFTIILIGVSIFYLFAKKVKITLPSMIFISITAIFSSVFVLSANHFIKGLVMIYVIFSSVYWFYYTCNKHDESIINDMFIFYFIKSILIMPFSCCFYIYDAFSRMFKINKPKKNLLYIILGILCTIIPSLIIINLLMDADMMFNNIIQNIGRIKFFNLGDFRIELLYLIISLPVAMYIFGILYSNTENMYPEILSRDANNNIINKLKFTPELIVYTAVTPICLIYVLFFFSQSAYFMSAFSNIIPAGYSYAEYARQGFFELCSVVIINACIIIFIAVITKSKRPNILKTYIITISIFTLMLIATALSKMIMYINNYGLTLKRVYSSWFMILLACIFILLIVKQFAKKMNFFLIAFIIFIILFSVLIFCDIDAVIAQYNIENYLNGNLEELDFDMLLYELSDSAVEYIISLTDNEPQYKDLLKIKYSSILNGEYSMKFENFNFASCKAYRLLNSMVK